MCAGVQPLRPPTEPESSRAERNSCEMKGLYVSGRSRPSARRGGAEGAGLAQAFQACAGTAFRLVATLMRTSGTAGQSIPRVAARHAPLMAFSRLRQNAPPPRPENLQKTPN